jgi:hypothetical protein
LVSAGIKRWCDSDFWNHVDMLTYNQCREKYIFIWFLFHQFSAICIPSTLVIVCAHFQVQTFHELPISYSSPILHLGHTPIFCQLLFFNGPFFCYTGSIVNSCRLTIYVHYKVYFQHVWTDAHQKIHERNKKFIWWIKGRQCKEEQMTLYTKIIIEQCIFMCTQYLSSYCFQMILAFVYQIVPNQKYI